MLLAAIRTFYGVIDDESARTDREIEDLKKEVGLSVLELRIQHAIQTGQTHVAIPMIDKNGRRRMRMVSTQYFTDEDFKVEALAPYFD